MNSDRFLASTVLRGEFAKAAERRLAIWGLGGAGSAYSLFQDRYFNDLPGFVRECFVWRPDEGPADYQEDVLGIIQNGRTSVRGPHGLGKTAMAAWVILWFALTRDGRDWKAVTTASAWRQLTKYLWPEVHKWARRVRWDVVGRPAFNERTELLQLSLKLTTGEAFAVASDNPALIEGAHADHLLYIFDESKSVAGKTFDAAEGAFANTGVGDNEALALAISTPGEPQGRFYEIQSRKPGYEDWQVRRVTFSDLVRAGRSTWEWAKQRAAQWGEGSQVYKNRVLGEFAESDEDTIIPLAWVEAANDRWREWAEAGRVLPETTPVLGVDVGRGGDKTVLAVVYGMTVSELRKHGKADTIITGDLAIAFLNENGGRAVVDGIGVGAGTFDYVRKYKREHKSRWRVESFIASHKSVLRDASKELGFANRRAAAWWNMRELLDPANGYDVALPPDDDLLGQLTAPKWEVRSGGRILVEDKDEIRKRLDGRSTDDADAVIMAFARPEPLAVAPGIVVGGIVDGSKRAGTR